MFTTIPHRKQWLLQSLLSLLKWHFLCVHRMFRQTQIQSIIGTSWRYQFWYQLQCTWGSQPCVLYKGMCPNQILFAGYLGLSMIPAVMSRLAIDIHTQFWLVKFQGYVHLISHMITIPHSIHGLPQLLICFLSGILRPRLTCRGGSSREDDEVATATEGVGWVEGARNDGYHCWGGMYRIITYIYIYCSWYLCLTTPEKMETCFQDDYRWQLPHIYRF